MSRSIGKEGLQLIKSFEGCHLTAYKCPAGVWTIGYGHTSGVFPGMKISQKQADVFLMQDCQKFADYVDNPVYVPLTESLNDNQRDALISFTYNCGVGNLKQLCRRRNLNQIAVALLLYNKANGKILAGLTRRRKAEQSLFYKELKNEEGDYKMELIKKGSKGKAVKICQIIIGFSGNNVDGIFGDDTEKQVKIWQENNGLTSDGIFGDKSWKVGLESV